MGRVVYVLRAFPEPSETFIRTEIRALRKSGTDVTVLTATRSAPAAEDWTSADEADVPVIEIPGMALPMPKATAEALGLGARKAIRVARLAARAEAAAPLLPPDTAILHAHFANDAAVLARHIAKLTGLPYRVTAHAYDLYQDPLQLEENLLGAQRVLTISEANAAHIRKSIKQLRTVEVTRCGIDIDHFAYRDPPPPEEPARLLCVARLIPKKGHAVLLDALAELNKHERTALLALAGDGPLEPALRDRADDSDLARTVTFLGTLGHETVRDAMLSSDAVVLAARVADDGDRDGIPVALIEAMALGVPVVSTTVSGIPELVARGTGRLAPPDDPAALADAIRQSIAATSDARRGQAFMARKRIEQDFDIARIVERLRP
jgi:glycosyltransferase involved in cell wall biosynthesis